MIPAIVSVDSPPADAVRVEFVNENALDDAELKARSFEGKLGQSAVVTRDGSLVLVIGLGKDDLDVSSYLKLGAAITRGGWKLSSLSVELDGTEDDANAQAFAEGLSLAGYQYDEYKSESKPCELAKVSIAGASNEGLVRGARIAQANMFARDLINEPAATMTPIRLAALAQNVAQTHGLEVTVWDENDIVRENLNALLGVSLGSTQPPRFIQLRYTVPGAKQTVAIVGKGITFDSGGLSLKPSGSMMGMKHDMAGAAAVLATMSALKDLNVPVNVFGIMCCTENMPSGSALKLGDVLKARNGKTIEVNNTDAEGRLVLADGLSIAAESDADAVIDLATLTGAAIVALGTGYSCIMSNNEELVDSVLAAGANVDEKSWRLPLPPEYRKQIDSPLADMTQVGKAGQAGTIHGGLFLQEFVGDKPWVHMDIAGTDDAESTEGINAKGATGVGVRTLLELLKAPVPISA